MVYRLKFIVVRCVFCFFVLCITGQLGPLATDLDEDYLLMSGATGQFASNLGLLTADQIQTYLTHQMAKVERSHGEDHPLSVGGALQASHGSQMSQKTKKSLKASAPSATFGTSSYSGRPSKTSAVSSKQLNRLSQLIVTLARRYSLHPRLILAIIKAESHFDTWAVSPKGALGLMQIQPETAEWLVQQMRHSQKKVGQGTHYSSKSLDSLCFLDSSSWSSIALFDPEVNLTLGVRYLALLRKRYNGDLKAMLSAYNGGPTKFEKSGYINEYYHRVKSVLALQRQGFENSVKGVQ